MPPEYIPSDDEYASEEDSDFTPDAVPNQDEGPSSAEESEADDPISTLKTNSKGKPKPTKRKRADENKEEAEDAGFENSGDEAIIEKGLKRQKKKGRKQELEDDEGGEGGLVKTRSMRAQQSVEKKPLIDTSTATVDVDAIWDSMTSGRQAPDPQLPPTEVDTSTALSPKGFLSSSSPRNQPKQRQTDPRSPNTTLLDSPDSMVMIKRTFKFAGKITTEQKLVPRNSAEAKLYLASQGPPATSEEAPEAQEDALAERKRPVKKVRRSLFEPILDIPKRTDLHFGIRKEGNDLTLVGITGKEKRLNTIQKSAIDWAGFVDKEGIKDELDAAGKSKGAYRARQEFLARVEQKKEEDARKARGL